MIEKESVARQQRVDKPPISVVFRFWGKDDSFSHAAQ